jgi:hypothetical protein
MRHSGSLWQLQGMGDGTGRLNGTPSTASASLNWKSLSSRDGANYAADIFRE